MTFNDLPKQQRLLIYMFYYEAESGSAITMPKNGNDIIAYGISKNKNSLANMLYTLRKKELVTEAILRNGEVAYRLTAAGQDSARHFISLYGNDIEVSEAEDSLQETEAIDVDLADLVKAVASLVAQKYDNQPKQNANDKIDVDALYEQIAKLKAENEDLKRKNDEIAEKLSLKCGHLAAKVISYDSELAARDEKIASLSNSLKDALARLDKKTKQAQQLEDALSKIENSLGQMAAWAHSLKNGSSN